MRAEGPFGDFLENNDVWWSTGYGALSKLVQRVASQGKKHGSFGPFIDERVIEPVEVPGEYLHEGQILPYDGGRDVTSQTRGVVEFREATRVWFGISLRTFGGPAGQIAVMHRELVDERRWIGEERFLHALSYCTLLPGPEAQQLAIYLGWLLNGTGGGLMAGTLFVMPGYVALMALSAIYAQWGATAAVTAVFAGLGPAVLAIVSQAVFRVAKRALRNRVLVGIAVAAFIALFFFGAPFPMVIAAAGALGWIASKVRPELVTSAKASTIDGVSAPLIADDALHGERPSLSRAVRLIVIGSVLWAAPIVSAAMVLGRSHVIVQEGVFFSGTAMVTFGGAYAVLAFVAQRAVSVYQWLLPGEMVHGLALAETTPGPLIMVVQFVAFLGAFRNPGTLNPWVAAIIGSTVAVWATFVPCFLLVFLGAPHIEGLRHNRRLSAALTGITAAVVGVIANLSVYFSIHTLFSRTRTIESGPIRVNAPVWATVSPRAVAVCLLAFFLVFRAKLSVLRVLGVCAAVGASLHLWSSA
jgi:chromate transporter